ncbi:DUF6265 family protein [Lewinella sp. W8]|uniref:DUF6265 family protein n=1 Tax=Lewinella sp. W8 TaxID=2528208 RepID=UPI001068AEA0|nr:DUF6265 family protein [Lewinella sp. W8]MTB51137.1 hypothetical protein [Lewinella sp. W8]
MIQSNYVGKAYLQGMGTPRFALRSIVLFLITLPCLMCGRPEPTYATLPQSPGGFQMAVADFHWLVGHWVRQGQPTDTETHEIWRTHPDGALRGHGFILRNQDTVWEEKMVFAAGQDGWQLTVETPGNDDAVIFDLTASGNQDFVVENPQHDFPQRIHYWREADTLKAAVSADSTLLSFVFSPKPR